MRQRGFTLMEMLIALGIFALIGVASYRLLQVTAAASEQGMARSAALHERMLALQLLEGDLLQALPASVQLDERGLTLLRAGAGHGLPGRGDLRRLRYQAEGDSLLREWLPLASDAAPLQQALLLAEARFVLRDVDGQAHESWPPLVADAPPLAAITVYWTEDAGGRSRVFSLR